mmetsp:Transcript_9586/g.37399  ORF Transcript_9586/g.37399 Transcript_9586/m.37399 type:complete len:213 (-) Transcript_9586:947-1585(-)
MRDDGRDRRDRSPRGARTREVWSLDDHRLHLLDSLRGRLPLREAPRLGHPRHRGLFQHQPELPEELLEVREGVIAVVRLVVKLRKSLERLVESPLHPERLSVANLRGIDEEQLTPGLQHPRKLPRRVPSRLLGHLVEEVHVGDGVEGRVVEGHLLAVGLHELQRTRARVRGDVLEPLVALAHGVEVVRGELDRGAVQLGPVIAHEREETARP